MRNLQYRFDRYYVGQIYSGDITKKFRKSIFQPGEEEADLPCQKFPLLRPCSKKADSQVFRSAEVQKSARKFSQGLDF